VDCVRKDLIVPLTGVDTSAMLEFWRWLIPESHRPLFATALGDLFLTDPDGRVLWLDMGDGELQVVAANDAEFGRVTADPENNSLWFGATLVDQLRAAGEVLGPGECYCYVTLPMLGGEYDPVNFRVYDVVTHFRVWGPIHEQLRDLPDGPLSSSRCRSSRNAGPAAASGPGRVTLGKLQRVGGQCRWRT
jgi:hypothetical protein